MTRLFIYWELEKPWQIIYPLLGCLTLFGLSYKVVSSILNQFNIGDFNYPFLAFFLTLLLGFFLIYVSKELLEKIEFRFSVTYKWEVIAIILVFSITGSTSIAIGRPFLKLIGITKNNLDTFIYYPLFIVLSFTFYQIFLVFYGWLFGQFNFFWNIEKKMLSRFGITL